jgi:hypothetical protein
MIKDMAPLLHSRNSSEIVIVDTKDALIDEDNFSSVKVPYYKGTVSYHS